MAARVCRTCLTNWPNVGGFLECPVCGEDTEYGVSAKPEFSEEEAKAHAQERRTRLEAERRAPSPEHANRVERYLELGFSEVDAQVLALATWTYVDSKRRRWVRPVNHLDVAKALAAGCSHALALEIFT